MTQASNPAIVAQTSTGPVHTPWTEFWHKFHKQHLAMGADVFMIVLAAIAILAPYIVLSDPEDYFDYDALNAGPSAQHQFGIDLLGCDIFSRILMGTRISLEAGFVSVIIGAIIGTVLGLLTDYHEGRWDRIVMRISDVLFAFPGILLAIDIVVTLGNDVINMTFAVVVFSIPTFTRLVHGSTLVFEHLTYVEVARSIGVSSQTIVMRHILPDTISSIVVYFSMQIGTSIITVASLSFLGLGVQPPTPKRGVVLNEACADVVTTPYVVIFLSLAIFLIVLAFNLLGNGLRDMLDPKIGRR